LTWIHFMVLQQFDGALNPGQGRLELVTDGGGEIAQIAGAAIDGLGHPPEILIKGSDFDGGSGRRGGQHAATVGDIARRRLSASIARAMPRESDVRQ